MRAAVTRNSTRSNPTPSRTHLKIDVDGAEFGVLKGAEKILANPALTNIFIEIDNENAGIVEFLESRGFSVSWRYDKPQNADVLFTR